MDLSWGQWHPDENGEGVPQWRRRVIVLGAVLLVACASWFSIRVGLIDTGFRASETQNSGNMDRQALLNADYDSIQGLWVDGRGSSLSVQGQQIHWDFGSGRAMIEADTYFPIEIHGFSGGSPASVSDVYQGMLRWDVESVPGAPLNSAILVFFPAGEPVIDPFDGAEIRSDESEDRILMLSESPSSRGWSGDLSAYVAYLQ